MSVPLGREGKGREGKGREGNTVDVPEGLRSFCLMFSSGEEREDREGLCRKYTI